MFLRSSNPKKIPFNSKYKLDELIAITDEWEYVAGYRHRPWVLVMLMDTMSAMKVLSDKQKEAVFLVGLCQMRLEDAAALCSITKQSMWERYQRGLQNMAHYLNGETYTK